MSYELGKPKERGNWIVAWCDGKPVKLRELVDRVNALERTLAESDLTIAYMAGYERGMSSEKRYEWRTYGRIQDSLTTEFLDRLHTLDRLNAQAERIAKLEAENERLRRIITQAPAEPAKERTMDERVERARKRREGTKYEGAEPTYDALVESLTDMLELYGKLADSSERREGFHRYWHVEKEGTDKLGPCRFCGGTAEMRSDGNDYVPCCENEGCWATLGIFATEDEAVAAWNRSESRREQDTREAVEVERKSIKSEVDKRSNRAHSRRKGSGSTSEQEVWGSVCTALDSMSEWIDSIGPTTDPATIRREERERIARACELDLAGIHDGDDVATYIRSLPDPQESKP